MMPKHTFPVNADALSKIYRRSFLIGAASVGTSLALSFPAVAEGSQLNEEHLVLWCGLAEEQKDEVLRMLNGMLVSGEDR